MRPDYTNARSADGPTIYAWMSERYPIKALAREDAFAAVVESWNRENRLVDFYTLDEWLTPRGFFLSELPAECWRWTTPKIGIHNRPIAEQVIAEYAAGERGRNELAVVYRIERRTVRQWIDGIEVAA